MVYQCPHYRERLSALKCQTSALKEQIKPGEVLGVEYV